MKGSDVRPAVDGWFSFDAGRTRLIGLRDPERGSYYFPPEPTLCGAPADRREALERVELSERGRLWSFTTNRYPPPPPYVAPEPFVPYTVVAVELGREQMVILGQLAASVDPKTLRLGMEMELTTETLLVDDDGEQVVWKWRPSGESR